ncbi:MAG: RNA polymerase sigma factor WhiG [Treponema sp.]|jgi:RNA polymerase sigma factor for flagellar operon FliA|nr:RNA polymerase sigma factor WhiG [Treponema sp.]
MGKVLGNNSLNCSLEQKTEEELWVEYRQNKDPKIREAFIKQYAPLVKYVAGKVAVGMPHNVEFDDLVGFGVFGLIDAIDRFDPEKNVKFKTYAVPRIKGAIFDELRSIDWVPRSVRQKTKEVEEVMGALEAQLGRSATDQEIARALGMDENEFLKTMMRISATSILSLNDVWFSGDENDKVSIGDSIESPASLNPDVIVEKDEIRQIIINSINELPDKEKKILVLYYYEDLTLKEIGQVMGITESRVSQLHTKAILRLRSRLTNVRKGIV